MRFGDVSFSVASHTAWAPGLDTAAAWLEWAHGRAKTNTAAADPKVAKMPPMLRRRASVTGKMALETAYACLPEQAAPSDLPVIFASRHGECARSVELLQELAQHAPLSPTAFSLSVHNANGGLWSIARGDRSNNIAIAAGTSTVEHALIEACGLLADGARQVLLVMADSPPPDVFSAYSDCVEQGFSWAWLLQADNEAHTNAGERLSLSWTTTDADSPATPPADAALPGGLDILRFFLRRDAELTRVAGGRRWRWSRHA
jgi:hypothetical protein